jgi:hypothetical protein
MQGMYYRELFRDITEILLKVELNTITNIECMNEWALFKQQMSNFSAYHSEKK